MQEYTLSCLAVTNDDGGGAMEKGVRNFLLIGLAMLLLGTGFTYWGVSNILETLEASSWPTTKGLVKKSAVRVDKRRERTDADDKSGLRYRTYTYYIPEVVYEYTVNNKNYTSDRITTAKIEYRNKKTFGIRIGAPARSIAQSIVDNYKAGSTVDVYHQPGEPGTALLDTSLRFSLFIPLLITIPLIILALWLIHAALAGKIEIETEKTPVKKPRLPG